MPEGLLIGGKIAGAVHDDPDSQPAPSEEAPRGWTWNRGSRSWKPKVRGPILWDGAGAEVPADGPAAKAPQEREPEVDRDPGPRWVAEEKDAPAGARVKYEDIPKAVKDDIAGLGGLVATPILALVKSVDPYCGGALADSFGDVMDATLPLICRSEKIVRYFSEDTADWLLWGKLALALAPVGRAIAEHHIFRSVEVRRDEKTGQVMVLRRTAGGEDHLTPPVQPEYDASAYAA